MLVRSTRLRLRMATIPVAIIGALLGHGVPTVARASTGTLPCTVTLTAAPGATVGLSETLTVTVAATSPGSPVPSGGVVFTSPDAQFATTLGATGSATTTIWTPMQSGVETMTATYLGDTNYASCVASQAVTVAKAPTNVSLTASPSSAAVGALVTLTATATTYGTPTGTFTFLEGGTSIGTAGLSSGAVIPPLAVVSGTAQLTTSSLGVGTHSITAQYSGDAIHQASTSSATSVSVQPTSHVAVFTWTDPSVPGQHVVVEAYVPTAPGRPAATGTVTFLDGATSIGSAALDQNGYAAVYVPFTTAGTHSLTAQYSGDSNTQAATSPVWTQTVADASPDQRFVDQLYDDILNRVPDAGAASWATALDQGRVSHTQVALALTSSTEYLTGQVDAMYGQFLGRAPDPAGLAFWVRYIQGTGTFEDLEISFLGAPEYYTNAGGTNDAFLTALYADVFGRAPDVGGRAYWDARLAGGTPAWVVAASLVTSTEAMSNRVTGYYYQLLWRAPDAAGLSYWVARLQSGARDQDLMGLLAGSDEYWQKTQAY